MTCAMNMGFGVRQIGKVPHTGSWFGKAVRRQVGDITLADCVGKVNNRGRKIVDGKKNGVPIRQGQAANFPLQEDFHDE